MAIADKLQIIAENEQKVYEAGKKAEYDEFWDNFQKDTNGNFKTYLANFFTGSGWNDINFKPKYDIKPIGNAGGIFRQVSIQNLKKCLEDSSVVLDLSQATNLEYAFAYTSVIRILPKLDFSSATSAASAFNSTSKLESIEELKVSTTTKFSNSTFTNCGALAHLIMTGELASDLNLQWSPLLDKESIISILYARSLDVMSDVTLSLAAVNKAFETSEGANDGSTSTEWEDTLLDSPWGDVNLI